MAWYPDWVVALDEVAKGVEGARVTQDNAQSVIREIEKMQKRIGELERGGEQRGRHTAANAQAPVKPTSPPPAPRRASSVNVSQRIDTVADGSTIIGYQG